MGKVLSTTAKIHVTVAATAPSDDGVELWRVLRPLIEKKSWDKVHEIILEQQSVIMALTEADQPTGSHQTPLQVALSHLCPVFIVKSLLELCPVAAVMKDYQSEMRTPLQNLMVRNKASPNYLDGALLRAFIDMNPSCLLVGDANGSFPLHTALECRIESALILDLLQSCPIAARKKTTMGKLPLHFAAEFQASSIVVEQLIMHYPRAVMEWHDRRLPLHFASEYRASADVIAVLLAVKDEEDQQLQQQADADISISHRSVRCKGYDGMLPIHIAMQHQASLDVVRLLVNAYPEALVIKDRLTKVPLHYAIERTIAETVVRFVLRSNPTAASIRSRGSPGNYSLSMAIERHYSHELVRDLLEAFPQAAQEPNIQDMLPLRSAMRHSSNTSFTYGSQTIELLLAAYPKAAEETDEYGRIALHYAASRNMATKLIDALIKAFPSGLRLRDKNSQIPLHLAVMRKIDLDKMDLLLQRSPDAVLETDKYGFNCLNYAVEYDAPLDVFQLLLSANVACAAHCVKGKTVLHQAIEFKRSYPVIQAIVQAYPQAARMQEPIEGRLPLHWAIERLLHLDVLECIDDANPKDGASVRSHKGWCSIHYAVHTPTPIEVVRRILRAYPDIAYDTSFSLHLDYQSQQQRLQQAAIAARAKMVRSDSRVSRGRKRIPLNKYGGEVGAVHDGEDDVFESDRFVQKHSTIDGGSEAAVPAAVPASSSAAVVVVDDTKGGSIVTKFMLLHYASMHRKTLYETIGEILLLTMPYSVDGQFRKDHEDTWAYILGECGDAYWQSIDYVLTRYEHDQSLVRTLSEFTDKLVRKAIDIATPKSLYQIVRRLHYCSRFEMGHGQLHKSQYCMLFCATDHDVKLKRKAAVVLKFSKNRTTFMRDIIVREMVSLSDQFVVPLLQHYNAYSDDLYRAELVRNQFEEYPYLSVFKAGEKDLLSIISHEYLAGGRNEGLIRQCCVELMRAVHHLHDKGIVHGSLKPSNVIRDECLKITNLGHASRYSYCELVTGEISQLAYASPEVARLQCSKELKAEMDRMKTAEYQGTVQLPIVDESRMHDEVNDLSLDPTQGGLRIAADPAQDMWSVGAIIYYLCTGETLFLVDNEEGIDADQLQMLIDWPDFAKQKRVNKVKSPAARHLVSMLLSKDPLLRPSASYCLTYHPYLLQQQDGDTDSVRFPGEGSRKYDVFISYRKQSKSYRSLCTDNDHCGILTELFANRGISVISTSDCSGTAVRNSSSSLSHSMTHSSAAIIILSHYALFKAIRSVDSDPNTGTTNGMTAAGGRETALSIFEKMSANSEFDEFLYELRLAVELRSVGLLEKGLFIVAVGEQLPIESSDQLSVVVDDRGRSSGCSPVDLSVVDRFIHWKNVSYSTYFEEHYGEMIGYYGGSHSRSAMPHVTVRSVETALDSFLHDSGYGKSTLQDLTIMELFRYLVRLPTYHIVGPQESAFQHAVDSLADVLSGASVILSNRASTGKVVASADVVIADVALSRPSTAAFDMILGSTIRNNPITMMTPMMHTSKSRAATPALMEGLLQSEHFDNRTRSPLTGLRVQAYIPSGDSPKKPSSQQRSLHDLSTSAGIRIIKTPALDDALASRRGSPDIMNSSPGTTFGESFRIPIQTWDAAADDDPINYTAAGVNFASSLPMEVPFVDIELNNGNSYHKLPYFTEIVGEDRVRSAAALSFMSSKLEVSENHIANLQDELMLLRKKMSSSDAELADLRNKMAKGSIRYPPSSSSKKRPK